MYSGKILASVVIAAAGKGSRMGMKENKQYIEVSGKPVLARTIQKFEDCCRINDIKVVVNETDVEFCKENIIRRFGFRKVSEVVPGGPLRQQSVYNGLKRLPADCGIVLIHDGARPFIDTQDIINCIDAVEEYGAAVVAVPAKDTIKRSDTEGFVAETLDRSSLWYVQTPQGFKYGLIIEAHRKACEDGFTGTDDSVLVERLGHKVRVVRGSCLNIKITTKEDLLFAGLIGAMTGNS
ncbi:MAG: 2-C-methyl-D-erythritol 4-phosphate cytidylyltransferase [Bacillota bacterium]